MCSLRNQHSIVKQLHSNKKNKLINENKSTNLASEWTGASTRESKQVRNEPCYSVPVSLKGSPQSEKQWANDALSRQFLVSGRDTEMEWEWETTRQVISQFTPPSPSSTPGVHLSVFYIYVLIMLNHK